MGACTEEIVARAFRSVARLTQEQEGALKLFLAIMQELDADEANGEKAEKLKAVLSNNFTPGQAAAIGEIRMTAKETGAPENVTEAPENVTEKPEIVTEEPTPATPVLKPGRGGPRKRPQTELAPEAARFAEYLIAHGIPQKQAAAEIGYKTAYLSNVIGGRDKPSEKMKRAMKEYVDAREENPTRAAVSA